MHQQRLKSKTDLVTLVAYGLATISAITAFAVASSNLTSSLFNFTLSNSGDIVANVGDKVKNIISAKLISGKGQLIYFRTLNLPPGIKAIFSKKSCIPSCSTTLTLSTAGASEGRYPITVEGYKYKGRYPLTVEGYKDKAVKQTTFYLTLIKKGDFVFKLTNDGDKKITQGETAISNITVNAISGKPSAVELELNKYPAGLEYKFDPPSCTPLKNIPLVKNIPLENLGGQCKAKLYLYSGQVKAGKYGIEVKGLNQNGKQATTAFTLIIKEPVLR